MNFSYFLANFLFGMTLLTAAMAVAHLVGDFLANQVRNSSATRTALRVMSLLCCALFSLWLFLVKLSGTEFDQALSGMTVGPRLFKQVSPKFDDSQDSVLPTFKDINSENSWTFIDLPSEEFRSEMSLQLEILKKQRTWVSLVNKQNSADCRNWKEKLQDLGVKFTEASVIPSSVENTLLACASEKQSEQYWGNLRDWVSKGGKVFLVGHLVDVDASVISQLLQVKTWRVPDQSTNSTFVFGGDLFAFGSLPSGLKISVDEKWRDSAKGQGLVNAEGQNRLQGDSLFKVDAPSSFVSKSFLKGRIVWTSLPAYWSEKNKALFGDAWDLGLLRTVAFLNRSPLLGIAPYPSKSSLVVVNAINAEYEFKNARSLEKVFKKLQMPSSYYLVMSEALNDSKTIRAIEKQELGASSFNHSSMGSLDFYEQVDEWNKWKKGFLNLEINKASQDKGALLLNADSASGDLYAAVMANRFSYVLGTPDNDSSSPRLFSLKLTSEAKEDFKNKVLKRLNGSKGEILALPITQGNDFDFYQDSVLSPAGKIEDELGQRRDLALWQGSPFVFVAHTQVLGTDQGLESYENFLTESKEKNILFMTARSYLEWWSAKSSLAIKLESYSDNEINVSVSNVGAKTVRFVDFKMVLSDGWIFDNSSDGQVVELSELSPGKSITLKLTKRVL